MFYFITSIANWFSSWMFGTKHEAEPHYLMITYPSGEGQADQSIIDNNTMIQSFENIQDRWILLYKIIYSSPQSSTKSFNDSHYCASFVGVDSDDG